MVMIREMDFLALRHIHKSGTPVADHRASLFSGLFQEFRTGGPQKRISIVATSARLAVPPGVKDALRTQQVRIQIFHRPAHGPSAQALMRRCQRTPAAMPSVSQAQLLRSGRALTGDSQESYVWIEARAGAGDNALALEATASVYQVRQASEVASPASGSFSRR